MHILQLCITGYTSMCVLMFVCMKDPVREKFVVWGMTERNRISALTTFRETGLSSDDLSVS